MSIRNEYYNVSTQEGLIRNDDSIRIIVESSRKARNTAQADKIRNIVRGIVNKKQENGSNDR